MCLKMSVFHAILAKSSVQNRRPVLCLTVAGQSAAGRPRFPSFGLQSPQAGLPVLLCRMEVLCWFGLAAGNSVLEMKTWKEVQCVTEAGAAAGASAALLAAG